LSSNIIPTEFGEVASRLRRNGYLPIPALPGTKRPAVSKWQHAAKTLSPTLLSHWVTRHSDAGVFLCCGELLAIDIDVEDAQLNEVLDQLCQRLLAPSPIRRIGKAPRSVLFYRADATARTVRMPGLEIRAKGAGVMAFGTHPETKRPYYYPGATPLDVPLAALPVVTAKAIAELEAAVRPLLVARADGSGMKTEPVVAAAGKMADGRERFVRDAIFRLYRDGWRNEHAIATAVFDNLRVVADLERPHSSGDHYDYQFVLNRVQSTLRNAKPVYRQGPRPVSSSEPVTTSGKAAFHNAVNAAGALGMLRPSSVLVSHAMLASIGAANSAFTSTATLAHRTGLAIDTVKAARRELRRKGFWSAVDDAGGRALIAHYLPNLNIEDYHD